MKAFEKNILDFYNYSYHILGTFKISENGQFFLILTFFFFCFNAYCNELSPRSGPACPLT